MKISLLKKEGNKNEKNSIVILIITIIMSITITAYAATYGIDWMLDIGKQKHGSNRFSMSDNTVIQYSTFVTSPYAYIFAIGIYNNDDSTYHMRKFGTGIIFGGSMTGEEGVISFAARNRDTVRINVMGTYTY